MVIKGLSVGSMFEDGGLHYEVQAVLPNGDYISKLVKGADLEKSSKDREESTTKEKCVEKPQKEDGSTIKKAGRSKKA